MMKRSSLAVALLLVTAACSWTSAKQPKTLAFDEDEDPLPKRNGKKEDPIESPYSGLDSPGGDGGAADYRGFTLLSDVARISRPSNWQIRRAKHTEERTYLEYVSPHGYLFAIYKRPDGTGDSWKDIEAAYEESAKAKGVEILSSHIPVAIANAQGREYVVRRPVKGQRGVYTNTCRELLVRGEHNVVLVQVIHQGDTAAGIAPELMHVFETLQVL